MFAGAHTLIIFLGLTKYLFRVGSSQVRPVSHNSTNSVQQVLRVSQVPLIPGSAGGTGWPPQLTGQLASVSGGGGCGGVHAYSST